MWLLTCPDEGVHGPIPLGPPVVDGIFLTSVAESDEEDFPPVVLFFFLWGRCYDDETESGFCRYPLMRRILERVFGWLGVGGDLLR